jgi:hypothetical protein
MRVSTLGTIEAETAMAQKGELRLADLLTCKDSRQHQIQNCNPMVEAAGRYTEKWHLTQVSHEEHGTGKYGSAVVELSRSCLPDSVAGHVVWVYAHAAAQQKQVATTV